MAFTDFPSRLLIKSLDSSEEASLGVYSVDITTELVHGQLGIYIHGTLGGTEQLRLNVYGTSGGLIAQSSWSDLSDISSIGNYWLGRLRFDFSEEILTVDKNYTIKIESNNYTRNGDTFYIGYILDWPVTINGSYYAAAISIIGNEV